MSLPQQSGGIKDSLSSSITDVHNDHSANIACSSYSVPILGERPEQQNRVYNEAEQNCRSWHPIPQPNTVVTEHYRENLKDCI